MYAQLLKRKPNRWPMHSTNWNVKFSRLNAEWIYIWTTKRWLFVTAIEILGIIASNCVEKINDSRTHTYIFGAIICSAPLAYRMKWKINIMYKWTRASTGLSLWKSNRCQIVRFAQITYCVGISCSVVVVYGVYGNLYSEFVYRIWQFCQDNKHKHTQSGANIHISIFVLAHIL